MRCGALFLAVVGASAGSAWAVADFAGMDLRVVAVTGQSLPGSSLSARFFVQGTVSSQTPTVSRTGLVMLPQLEGLYVRDARTSAPLIKYVTVGTPMDGEIPGQGGSPYGWHSVELPIMDGHGRIVGASPLNSSALKISSIGGGIAETIAWSNTTIPGEAMDVRWRNLSHPSVAQDGSLAFMSRNSFDNQLWTWSPTAGRTLLLSPGSQAPGLDAGVTIAELVRVEDRNSRPLATNDQGEMLVCGNLAIGPGVTTTNRFVVWRGTPGNLSPVLRSGMIMPGGEALVQVRPEHVVSNDAGDIAAAVLSSTSPTHAAKVIAVRNGVVSYVAKAREAGPGLVGGETWSSSSSGGEFSQVLMNGQGKIAFAGNVNALPSPWRGVWFGDENGLEMVARRGSTVPEWGAAFVYDTLYEGFAVNSVGDVVFQARITGPGLDSDALGLFHWSPDTGLKGLLKTGDVMEVAPGVFKTVDVAFFAWGSGGQDGRALALNDRRDFAFGVSFTDETGGAFTISVPAPGAAGVLVIAGLTAFGRRRVRRGE